MNSKQAKEIPLDDFMNRMGYNPKKKSPGKLWYKSPLRDENTASFQLDLKMNTWYDFGEGQGGTIIDLVMAMYQENVKQALARIDSTYTNQNKTMAPQVINKQQSIFNNEKQKYSIQNILPLENKLLINYLQSRKVNIDIAKKYLLEVYYSIDQKNYFAIGFKNNSDGFEIRNKYFKGGLLKKDITTLNIKNNAPLYIFEGFIDFLSYLTYFNINSLEKLGSVIVLNSNSMQNIAIQEIKKIEPTKLIFVLDNDNSGHKTMNTIYHTLKIDSVKQNNIYKDYKDFNDFLMNTKKNIIGD